ncbi:MAG: cytochrome b/b6 domain-containing protein [Thiobacillaceae bacterium]
MEASVLSRTQTYDPVLRIIHAWNAILVFLLLASSHIATWLEFSWEVAALWRLHLWCGYLLIIGLVARLVWGIVGPSHARWSELWRPAVWLEAVRKRRFFSPPEALGHHPLASLAYLLFYGMASCLAITGLALAAIDQGVGPLYGVLGYAFESKSWFRTPHDWLEELILAFVIVHLAALILHERRHGIPIAQAMVSGYQYRKDKEE